MRVMSSVGFSVAVLLTACGGGGEAGHERGACYTNHTCEPGLLCLSDLCVAPAPVPCNEVGDKLASFKVGNYAPREERVKLAHDLTGACDEARLSAEDGKCILEATSLFELSRCPKPMLPEAQAMANDKTGCQTVASVLEQQARTEFARNAAANDPMMAAIPKIVGAAQQACVEDKWSDEVKGCVAAAAKSPREMDGCFQKLTSAQRDSLTKRVGEAMKDAVPQ